MSQTFDGKPAGYATLAPDSGSGGGKSPAQETGAVGVPVQPIEKESSSDKESATPSEIRAPTDSTSLGSVLAKATGEASVSPTAEIQRQPSTPLSMPSTTSDSDAASANKDASSGTSAGAKAGIALGVLGGLFLIGMIVFLIFNRRKKQAQREKIDDEKMHGAPAPMAGADHLQAMPTSAPRISLRPVTQFLPNWNLNDKRTSKGAAMALGPTSAAQRGPETNAWDRPGTSQSNHPNNPFGNSAERVDADERGFNGPNGQAPRPQDPFTANGPTMAAVAAAGAAAAGGAATLTRKTSMRKNGDRAVDLTLPSTLGAVPPSPAGTEFSQSSVPAGSVSPPSHGAAAIAAAGGPATSTVHRVQLDFKPTLDDEMELKAGDLVRLLHEYDDGWVSSLRHVRTHSNTNNVIFIGAVHPPGQVTARCRPPHMSFRPSCQAATTSRCPASWTACQPAKRLPAWAQPASRSSHDSPGSSHDAPRICRTGTSTSVPWPKVPRASWCSWCPWRTSYEPWSKWSRSPFAITRPALSRPSWWTSDEPWSQRSWASSAVTGTALPRSSRWTPDEPRSQRPRPSPTVSRSALSGTAQRPSPKPEWDGPAPHEPSRT